MGSNNSATTATNGLDNGTAPLRQKANVSLTVTENTATRKAVRYVCEYELAAFKSHDGSWVCSGAVIDGTQVARVGDKESRNGYDDWQRAIAYGARNFGLALGNRAVNLIDPPVEGAPRSSGSKLLAIATANVDRLIKRGRIDAADRDAEIEAEFAALQEEAEEKRAESDRKAEELKAKNAKANAELMRATANGATAGLPK